MEKSNVEHLFRTTKIVWVVFLVSQVSLLMAVFLAKKDLFNFDSAQSLGGEEPIVPIILAMMALFNLGLSFFLKSQATARAVEAQNPKQVQTANILALAFCESISIMGVVLAFAFNYKYFFLWFALGIFGMLLHYPRRENFMAAGYAKP